MDTSGQTGHLIVVSQSGYGKSTPLARYPKQSRGGLGVLTFRVTDKSGPVSVAQVVADTEGLEIMIISAKGQVIRFNLRDVRITGRATLGVIVWRDREEDDYVASMACFQENDYVQAAKFRDALQQGENGEYLLLNS